MLIHEPPDQSEETRSPDEGWWASILADEEIVEDAENIDSSPIVSKNGTRLLKEIGWEKVKQLYANDEIVQMMVTGYNRGGLLVECENIQGFVPISHLVDVPNNASESDKQNLLAGYVGRQIYLKVIECEPSFERIVFSERAALAGEGKRIQLFNNLKVNNIIEGTVTNITDFGVFVDLGGVEGLIHVSELSWGRVQHPADFVKVGSKIKAKVLQVNEETSRVALSLKQLQPNPWEILVDEYEPGDIVPVTITTILNFGVFAKLDEGVEGLIHVSSMALPTSDKNLNKYFAVGQKVKARILHIDPDRRRLGLGLSSLE